jgi:hypothetical protein
VNYTKNKFIKIFFEAVILTLVFLTIYSVSQQVLRISANDPQIQIAEDTATALVNGAAPAEFMPSTRQPSDVSQSLATFIIIFDQNGTALESSATLSGQVISPPVGVFEYARIHGEDRFTWQPTTRERFAAVLKYYSGGHSGFVLVGRSLREVENREDSLLKIVALAWLLSIFVLIMKYSCQIYINPAKNN